MLECNCCFDKKPNVRLIACRDGHITCKSCLKRYVNTALGTRKEITCPDQSFCRETFSETILKSVLLPSQKIAYDKLQAELALKNVINLLH